MTITFQHQVPLETTMGFEALFEEPLSLDLEEKHKIVQNAYKVWLFCDDEIAGETYAITPYALKKYCNDEVEDTDPADNESAYCYTTSILPKFQGRYLAPVLIAYFMGYLSRYKKLLIGHTTTPRMKALRQMFGATFIGQQRPNWCGSERTACFYEQRI